MNEPTVRQLLWRGIFAENPVFRLALSLCPAVAVTTSVKNGLMMGVAVLAVQILSSGTVACFRSAIHDKVRIPVYTIIIAVWVSVIDMCLAAWAPVVYAEIGLYIKLIVAFAIIISRCELFASRHPLIPSVLDGLGMGAGFCLAMVLIGAFREVLGNGSIWGIALVDGRPILLFILPAGGFFTIGLLMAAMNWIDFTSERREREGGTRPALPGGGATRAPAIDVRRGQKLPGTGGGHG